MFAEFTLSLIRRHCFFTKYFIDPWMGKKDTLQIDVPIQHANTSLPLEFFMCQKRDLKKRLAELTHINSMLGNSNTKNYRLSDKDAADKSTLMVMSEHDEIANHLIDAKVGATLLKLGTSGMLKELHITD